MKTLINSYKNKVITFNGYYLIANAAKNERSVATVVAAYKMMKKKKC
jgi:hypothetical protein